MKENILMVTKCPFTGRIEYATVRYLTAMDKVILTASEAEKLADLLETFRDIIPSVHRQPNGRLLLIYMF